MLTFSMKPFHVPWNKLDWFINLFCSRIDIVRFSIPIRGFNYPSIYVAAIFPFFHFFFEVLYPFYSTIIRCLYFIIRFVPCESIYKNRKITSCIFRDIEIRLRKILFCTRVKQNSMDDFNQPRNFTIFWFVITLVSMIK